MPLYAYGSRKEKGLKRWSFYITLFLRIATGDSMALPISPDDYLERADRNPRLFAIMEAVQAGSRKWSYKKLNLNKPKLIKP